jgi:RHS repeat-associated protein
MALSPARFKGALHFQLNGVELHYMRNRLYEPKTGRFLSEDPIWLDGGINLYTFAGNDPVNERDPTGLDCQWKVEEYWTENAKGDALEKKTRLVRECDDGTREVFESPIFFDSYIPRLFGVPLNVVTGLDFLRWLFTPGPTTPGAYGASVLMLAAPIQGIMFKSAHASHRNRPDCGGRRKGDPVPGSGRPAASEPERYFRGTSDRRGPADPVSRVHASVWLD